MTMGRGSPETVLHEEDVAAIIEQGIPVRQFENKRVLVLTPDTTRTCPLPKIFEYDQILIVGPVFPHEVVGFSGGAKYLFPGISGGEFLHFFQWIGSRIYREGCWPT